MWVTHNQDTTLQKGRVPTLHTSSIGLLDLSRCFGLTLEVLERPGPRMFYIEAFRKAEGLCHGGPQKTRFYQGTDKQSNDYDGVNAKESPEGSLCVIVLAVGERMPAQGLP